MGNDVQEVINNMESKKRKKKILIIALIIGFIILTVIIGGLCFLQSFFHNIHEKDGIIYGLLGDHAIVYGYADSYTKYVKYNKTEIPDEDLEDCIIDGHDTYGKYREVEIPEEVWGLPVTEVDAHAFEDERKLQKISLPNSISKIGDNAFSNTSLESVVLPKNIEEWGREIFANCDLLKEVDILCNLTELNDAFINCSSLVSVNLPNSLDVIGGFSNCKSLESLTIPQYITEIEEAAFKDCISLSDLKIPSDVEQIGDYAFANCQHLDNITIPTQTRDIGNYAFSGCLRLKTINIYSSHHIRSVGHNAFENTKWLNDQPDGIVYIGKVLYTYKGDRKEVESVTICKSTIRISSYAFENCIRLKSIDIPASVGIIESYAFKDCLFLQEVTVQENGTFDDSAIIYDNAFMCCHSLNAVHIPERVVEIRDTAFINSTPIIYGKSGSAAYDYAKKNHIPFVEE